MDHVWRGPSKKLKPMDHIENLYTLSNASTYLLRYYLFHIFQLKIFEMPIRQLAFKDIKYSGMDHIENLYTLSRHPLCSLLRYYFSNSQTQVENCSHLFHRCTNWKLLASVAQKVGIISI